MSVLSSIFHKMNCTEVTKFRMYSKFPPSFLTSITMIRASVVCHRMCYFLLKMQVK